CYSTEVKKIEISKYLAIKNTLTMYDWIKGKELREMEEDYGILGGNLQKMGEGFSWLADTLSSLAEREGWKEVRADDLTKIRELSVRLIDGVESEGLSLARLNIPGLTRGYIQRLVREGYNNEQCLSELSDNQLGQILPELLIKRIKKQINSKPRCLDLDTNLNTNWELGKEKDKETDEECSKATIILNSNRPDRIIFLDNGIAVNKIGFQLISLLAKNEGKVLSYDQIIDTLWPSDEDATYHRLWYHLAKLKKEMERVIKNNVDKIKDKNNTLLADNGLKGKVFRVIPGIGIMFNPELQIKWTE
ncbi:MAG: winged helix-turn-helix domain-containing protein, partial [Atribacterota bacterium]